MVEDGSIFYFLFFIFYFLFVIEENRQYQKRMGRPNKKSKIENSSGSRKHDRLVCDHSNPFLNGYYLVCGHVMQAVHSAAWPGNLDTGNLLRLPEAKSQQQFAL